MDWTKIPKERRISAGFLFLFIALAILASQPIDNKLILALLGLVNLLISAGFFTTVGMESSTDEFDIGVWGLTTVVAAISYASVSFALTRDIDIVSFLAFITAFSAGLTIFSRIRDRASQ